MNAKMNVSIITGLDHVETETGEDNLSAARGIIYSSVAGFVVWMMILCPLLL